MVKTTTLRRSTFRKKKEGRDDEMMGKEVIRLRWDGIHQQQQVVVVPNQ